MPSSARRTAARSQGSVNQPTGCNPSSERLDGLGGRGRAQESHLCPRLLKVVMSNLRRDLAIRHLVDGVNPHDTVAEPFTLKMVFEFDLSLTRA